MVVRFGRFFAMIFIMKAAQGIPFIDPRGMARPIPLERYLPECPVGVIAQYLGETTAEDSWILDPFGSNPLLGIEAARAARRVLVTCNNPVLIFSYPMLAHPPEKNQFLEVLSELASQLRGKERIETHIKGLYQTHCVICHNSIQASGYLWRRNETNPYARVYHCPNCGDEGEHAISEEDLAILQPLQRGESIHRGRALSRVLQGNEEDRPAVEEALKVYNARSLYVLFTLLNRLEGMTLSSGQQTLANALMISLLDAGTSLWTWPSLADQPRQLTIPAVYYEKNLWTELEHSIDLWSQPAETVEYTLWPKLPDRAGICLFPGPVRNLEALPADLQIDRLLCLPPRPNQAFWTLSALWSAWLWGHEADNRFNQVLGRRRFDWHWHTQALYQAFEKAAALTTKPSPVFTLISEPSPGMVFATAAASIFTGFELEGFACKSPEIPIQSVWKTEQKATITAKRNPQSIAREAIRSLLMEIGEPVHYISLYGAAVSAIVQQNGFPNEIKEFTQEKSTELQGMIAALFTDEEFLKRYDVTSQEMESGKWGLVNWQNGKPSLTDRVEETLVGYLRAEHILDAVQIGQRLNSEFPGFFTPPSDLIEYCLTSYADWNPVRSTWALKEGEKADRRNADLEKARQRLTTLGEKMKYRCCGTQPLLWEDNRRLVYRFFFSASAGVSQFLQSDQNEEAESVLVFPGSRSALLKFKLLRDPHLRELTAHNWHFLKLRALQALSSRNDLTREVWAMQLDSDPINFEETTQLRIFG
jgi:hypothetical protein